MEEDGYHVGPALDLMSVYAFFKDGSDKSQDIMFLKSKNTTRTLLDGELVLFQL